MQIVEIGLADLYRSIYYTVLKKNLNYARSHTSRDTEPKIYFKLLL